MNPSHNFSALHTFAGLREYTISLSPSIRWSKPRAMITTFKLYGVTCTRTVSTSNGVSYQVVLPNGRKVKLCSKEGADEFVGAVGTDFISMNLTAWGETKLGYVYSLMETVAEHASPKKIADGIPESELRTFVEHSRDTLDTLSTDRHWLRRGRISPYHKQLLHTLTCFSMHLSFAKIFVSHGGMEAVAKFYASREKNDKPCPFIAERIVRLASNFLDAVLEQQPDSIDKSYGTLEKTGLLGQFIRCIPVEPGYHDSQIMLFLQTCLKLVKKKLKSGTPTGDILDAVIAGKDGPINEKAKSCLVKLQSMARLSNDVGDAKFCGHCGTMEKRVGGTKLLQCKQCRRAYYCNKECQVDDWKSHKKECKASRACGTKNMSARKVHQLTMRGFLESNCVYIAREVDKKIQEYNVPQKELLLEMDFFDDAPALRNEFKVGLMSRFLDGSPLVDEPAWLSHADKEEITQLLKNSHEIATNEELQTLCRSGDGIISVCRLNFPPPEAAEYFGRK
jgi:hypothetical protein